MTDKTNFNHMIQISKEINVETSLKVEKGEPSLKRHTFRFKDCLDSENAEPPLKGIALELIKY